MASSRKRTRTRTNNLAENLDEARRRIAECIRNKNVLLNLSELNLRQIPDEVSRLTWLTHLTAINNRISKVPGFLGRFRQLEELRLQENPIKLLPESLAQLTNLRLLHITNGEVSAA